jgi:hypothetical protein
VKICSLYGAGFYYMPGTDTCIKVGGYMRAEMNFNAGGSFAAPRVANTDNPNYDFEYTRVRGGITFDTRSQTEYGTLRSYIVAAVQDNNGTAAGGTPYKTLFTNAAFIQFAGFTAGYTASFFDFDTIPYSNYTNYANSSMAGNGIPVFAYTAQFGNGLSATISAEDTTARRSSIYLAGASLTANQYGGREWPDVVGNLRIDQAWGSAQVMGALHEVRSLDYAAFGTDSGSPSTEVGWAVGGGLKLNLPMLGKGDYVIGQVAYAKGAMSYVAASAISASTTGIGADLQTGSGTAANPLSVAYGPLVDATYGAAGTSLDLTEGWSFTGGFEHFWNTQWRTSLYGGYAAFNYSDTSSARLAAAAVPTITSGSVLGVAAPGAGSADWSFWQIGSRTMWTPVTNLDLSVDLLYTHYNTAFADQDTATRIFEDKGVFSGMFRVQRNFYP